MRRAFKTVAAAVDVHAPGDRVNGTAVFITPTNNSASHHRRRQATPVTRNAAMNSRSPYGSRRGQRPRVFHRDLISRKDDPNHAQQPKIAQFAR